MKASTTRLRNDSVVFSCWRPDLYKEIDFTSSRKYNTPGKLLNNSRKY